MERVAPFCCGGREMKEKTCYNCGLVTKEREADIHFYSYPDGRTFEVLDEFCKNCGTLIYGRDKKV